MPDRHSAPGAHDGHAATAPHPWLDYAGTAQYFSVSQSWLEHQVQAGKLPHHRLGRQVRFTVDDLAEIAALTRQEVDS